ncbi:hypothetical protein [Aureivirga sp. CE67]|uniref:hypothetical protein n=1 Tax=Aureivirga sp. CE67 TaxID=1788983 RepID=UPI0018CADA5A|nr:hypothetical protein [Aureivirga sp. CE67]
MKEEGFDSGKDQKLSYKEEIQQGFEDASLDEKFTPEFRKKKLIIWFVRGIISVIVYYFIWDYSWTKWLLMVHIPLAAINLFMILFLHKIMKNKLEKVKSRLD